MLLTPRYDGSPFLTIDGAPDDVLEPLTRQRRRLLAMLAELDDAQWAAPSRCEGWTVQDVVAHLVGVDAFWQGSVRAGLAGAPTAYLAGFDPAATPPMMVDGMRSLAPAEVLDQFRSACDGYLDAVADLDDASWELLAESPAGHVTVRILCAHALWDAWIHERDILLPLGLTPVEEPDEVLTCLRYAAVLSPTFALSQGAAVAGTYAVEVTDPDHGFALAVTDSVALTDPPLPAGAPCLRGPAVELVEALSMRRPLPATTPLEWQELMVGLATVFDSTVETASA
jgi:uncharacterized protein (TIGR03083 family)